MDESFFNAILQLDGEDIYVRKLESAPKRELGKFGHITQLFYSGHIFVAVANLKKLCGILSSFAISTSDIDDRHILIVKSINIGFI